MCQTVGPSSGLTLTSQSDWLVLTSHSDWLVTSLVMRWAYHRYEAVSLKGYEYSLGKEVYEASWQGAFTGDRYLYNERFGRSICA